MKAVTTGLAPPPAGPYSQAIAVGPMVFLAGQTPRTPEGIRLLDRPLAEQARQALDNLAVVAQAAGASLADTVTTTLYLRPGADVALVNAIYAEYFTEPFPARTTLVSDLTTGDLAIDAVLWVGP